MPLIFTSLGRGGGKDSTLDNFFLTPLSLQFVHGSSENPAPVHPEICIISWDSDVSFFILKTSMLTLYVSVPRTHGVRETRK